MPPNIITATVDTVINLNNKMDNSDTDFFEVRHPRCVLITMEKCEKKS